MDERGRDELLVRSLPRTPEYLLGVGVDCNQQCSNTARRAMVKPAAHLLLNLFLHPLTLGAKLNHIPCWHKSTKMGHVAETKSAHLIFFFNTFFNFFIY